jgi:hypothetical protein
VPVNCASTCPVHRALNVSTPIAAAGEPEPHAKSTVGSTRATVVPVKSMLL